MPALSASMVVVIFRRNRARWIFSPSVFSMSSSAGDKGAVFLGILYLLNGNYYNQIQVIWQG
jgi:hypothetical protein